MDPKDILNKYTTSAPQPQQQKSVVGRLAKGAIEKTRETLGFVERPTLGETAQAGKQIASYVAKDLPRDVLAGFSMVGKTVLEAVYGRDAVQRMDERADPRITELITRGPTMSYQEVKRTVDKAVEEHQGTPFEKKYLGAMLAVAGFSLDVTPFGARSGSKLTQATIKKLSPNLAKETSEEVVEKALRAYVSGPDLPKLAKAVASETDSNVIRVMLETATTPNNLNRQAARGVTPDVPAQTAIPETPQLMSARKQKPVETPSVVSYLDDSQTKVYTKLSAREMAELKKALGDIPTTPIGTRQLKIEPAGVTGKQVTPQEFMSKYTQQELPTAKIPKSDVARSIEKTTGVAPVRKPVTGNERTFLKKKLQQAQAVSKRASVATKKDIASVQKDLVSLVGDLPLKDRGKFIATIKNIQTREQLDRAMPNIQKRVQEVLGRLEQAQRLKTIQRQTRELIKERDLKNTESFRRALNLPSLKKMTVEQLEMFQRELGDIPTGGHLMSQRVLETIEKTGLKGTKTYDEVLKRLGMTKEEASKIQIGTFDRYKGNYTFAQQSPLHKAVVEKITAAQLSASRRFNTFENALDPLVREARASRKRGVGKRLGDAFVPTDKRVFDYLQSANKEVLAKEMTPAELRLANFLQKHYLEARDYLLKEKVMDKYVNDYITHIRRTGLEAVKEDGLVRGIKEAFTQYRTDRATFKATNMNTGEVLPLEKFFAFSLQRGDSLTPTKNVSRASKAYFMTLERKKAFDSVMPEIDAYVKAVKVLPNADPQLKKALYEFINTKRGKPIELMFSHGSTPDTMLRALMSFTRIRDLGLSIPNWISTFVGEYGVSYINMGARKYLTAEYRMRTKQGKAVLKRYESFIGRSIWKELRDTSKNLPDKAMTGMLGAFHQATVRANAKGLLGRMTKEEFRTGKVSPERLVAMKQEMSKWRVLSDTKSIYGGTTVGGVALQYKTWAVPIMTATYENLSTVIKTTAKGKNPFRTQAGQELIRETLLITTAGLVATHLVNKDDRSMAGEIINKSVREALSAIGALESKMWLSTPRAWQFVYDLNENIGRIIMMERYKSGVNEGKLRGAVQLGKMLTPAPVRQLTGQSSAPKKATSDIFQKYQQQTGPSGEDVLQKYQQRNTPGSSNILDKYK